MTFEIRRASSTRGSYYWRLVDADGVPIAESELYWTRKECVATIDLVRRECQRSTVADLTAESPIR